MARSGTLYGICIISAIDSLHDERDAGHLQIFLYSTLGHTFNIHIGRECYENYDAEHRTGTTVWRAGQLHPAYGKR